MKIRLMLTLGAIFTKRNLPFTLQFLIHNHIIFYQNEHCVNSVAKNSTVKYNRQPEIFRGVNKKCEKLIHEINSFLVIPVYDPTCNNNNNIIIIIINNSSNSNNHHHHNDDDTAKCLHTVDHAMKRNV